MKYLQVFKDVKIPTDYASIQKYAVLAMSDQGKTYLTLKMEEQMCAAGLFFATLDPVGKHWALRAGSDGDEKGGRNDVWVLGGLHGDVPLEPDSGSLIADTVVDHPGRYVLDVSTFETQSEQDRFATAFARRLFRRKARHPGFPLLLIMEEAEDFVPQNIQKGQEQMKGAFSRIQKLGRNYGIGTWLVSQRSQNLDKAVLGQAAVLIAKAMTAKLDRDKVHDWAEANGTTEQRNELMKSLGSLDRNEAWVWSPTWLKTFKRTTVLERDTFDSSRSLRSGETMEDIELVPLDIDALGEQMQESRVKADESDPKKLLKRLKEMEGELNRSQGALEDLQAAEEAVRELEAELTELRSQQSAPALDEEALKPLWEALDDVGAFVATGNEIRDMVRGAVKSRADGERVRPPQQPGPELPRAQPRQSAAPPVQATGNLTKLQTEIVTTAVALFPRPVPIEQFGILLAKSSQAGPFRKAVTDVKNMGYVDDTGRATDAGRDLVGTAQMPSAEQVQQSWRERLSGTKLKVYEAVLEAYPATIAPDQIGEAIGKDPNAGPIRKMFKDLAAWQLVEYDPQQGVRVSDYLINPKGLS